jgi:replicative DNA helicase
MDSAKFNSGKNSGAGTLVSLQGGSRPQSLHDEEGEAFVIGAILLDPDRVYDVFEQIPHPEAFYSESHRTIYAAQLKLAMDGSLPDLPAVATQLKKSGELEQVGGRAFLAELMDGCLSSAGVEIAAGGVQEFFVRRKLRAISFDNGKLAEDLTIPIAQVLERSEQALYGVDSGVVDDCLKSPQELASTLRLVYATGKSPGMASGFLDYDALTGGWFPGQLNIVAAPTGLGKSQFVIASAINFARKHNLPCFIFSCEMTAEEVGHRIVANLSTIDSDLLIQCKPLSPADAAKRDRAVDQLENHLPIYVFEMASPSVGLIRQVLRRASMQYGKLGLVILDYLQLAGNEEGERSGTRAEELDKIARACKGAAIQFKVPFIAVSQVKRAVADRQNKRPQVSDLKESGALENHANRIIMLHNDYYYDPQNAVDKGLIEVIVAKNRNGKKGDCKMIFLPEFSQFLDISKSY